MWLDFDCNSLQQIQTISQNLYRNDYDRKGNEEPAMPTDAEQITNIPSLISSLTQVQNNLTTLRKDICPEADEISINSDFDDIQMRTDVLADLDPEGFGEIAVDEFIKVLKSSSQFASLVPLNKTELLLDRARKAAPPIGSGYVTFQDFVNVMSGKRTHSFKCAVHHRDGEIISNDDLHLIMNNEQSAFKRMVHIIALETLPDQRDRKYYADRYICCPPPWFILLITIIELASFAYHTLNMDETAAIGPVPIYSLFIYRPDKRYELWRFVSYMFLHASWFHLSFNLFIQLLLGLPLEMVHGSIRIACIYFSGVLAGSLGTSIIDPEVCLVGASGGVYALLAAHLANVMINYHQMRYGILRLIAIFFFASCDVGFAVYARFADDYPSVSFIAHLTGALAGLTIGFLILKNFEQKLHEQLLWWIALGIYLACILFSIVFNIWNSNILKGIKI